MVEVRVQHVDDEIEHQHEHRGEQDVGHGRRLVALELRDGEGRLKSFSVQYHPEAAAGPHDAAYLFDRFVDLMHAHPSAGQTTHQPKDPA